MSRSREVETTFILRLKDTRVDARRGAIANIVANANVVVYKLNLKIYRRNDQRIEQFIFFFNSNTIAPLL